MDEAGSSSAGLQELQLASSSQGDSDSGRLSDIHTEALSDVSAEGAYAHSGSV